MRSRESFERQEDYDNYLQQDYYSFPAMARGLGFLFVVLILVPYLIGRIL